MNIKINIIYFILYISIYLISSKETYSINIGYSYLDRDEETGISKSIHKGINYFLKYQEDNGPFVDEFGNGYSLNIKKISNNGYNTREIYEELANISHILFSDHGKYNNKIISQISENRGDIISFAFDNDEVEYMENKERTFSMFPSFQYRLFKTLNILFDRYPNYNFKILLIKESSNHNDSCYGFSDRYDIKTHEINFYETKNIIKFITTDLKPEIIVNCLKNSEIIKLIQDQIIYNYKITEDESYLNHFLIDLNSSDSINRSNIIYSKLIPYERYSFETCILIIKALFKAREPYYLLDELWKTTLNSSIGYINFNKISKQNTNAGFIFQKQGNKIDEEIFPSLIGNLSKISIDKWKDNISKHKYKKFKIICFSVIIVLSILFIIQLIYIIYLRHDIYRRDRYEFLILNESRVSYE